MSTFSGEGRAANTIAAYDAALNQGADMVEIDVTMSTDGKLYAFHPGMEFPHLRHDRRHEGCGTMLYNALIGELARMGILPEGMYRNRAFAEGEVDPGDTPLCCQDILYDPQTSGGLLMAVHPEDADALFKELKKVVPSAQQIGTVREYTGGKHILLR